MLAKNVFSSLRKFSAIGQCSRVALSTVKYSASHEYIKVPLSGVLEKNLV